MSKGYKKTISINCNGIYYLNENNEPCIEIEEVGELKLVDILKNFENEVISFSSKLVEETE